MHAQMFRICMPSPCASHVYSALCLSLPLPAVSALRVAPCSPRPDDSLEADSRARRAQAAASVECRPPAGGEQLRAAGTCRRVDLLHDTTRHHRTRRWQDDARPGDRRRARGCGHRRHMATTRRTGTCSGGTDLLDSAAGRSGGHGGGCSATNHCAAHQVSNKPIRGSNTCICHVHAQPIQILIANSQILTPHGSSKVRMPGAQRSRSASAPMPCSS